MGSLQYFKSLFDPVIDEKHLGFGPSEKHPHPELEPAHVSWLHTGRGGNVLYHVEISVIMLTNLRKEAIP